jgi:hypothetical protein
MSSSQIKYRHGTNYNNYYAVGIQVKFDDYAQFIYIKLISTLIYYKLILTYR